jgi:cyclopropane-fatty-acyl-phospholipid synthase
MDVLGALIERNFTVGKLAITDVDGRKTEFRGDQDGPCSAIRVHDPKFRRKLFLNPNLAVGEGYMDGAFSLEEGDIFDLAAVCMANAKSVESGGIVALLAMLDKARRAILQYNPVGRAKNNVAHHYDLSDQLYDLFLDTDRQYSCAYYDHDKQSLEEAQLNKKRHIAAKLLIEPGMRVLDIGSGWGGLGIYLARTTGAEVVGVTLSEEQHRISRDRAAELGLAGQVDFRLQDYRQVTEKFDRIVSVGMFEHVGILHYPEFFYQVQAMLADDGVALLHTIGRADGPGVTNEFIRRYIFPGGYCPALSEIVPPIERTGMFITDVEILRLHYAETLKAWRKRYNANREKVRQIYDEKFCKMWEFYLAGSEAAFRYGGHVVFQIQFARRQDAVPLTRSYIDDWHNGRHNRSRDAAE